MSDQSSYKIVGDGPHPTLAGNVLDPNVSADGMKSGRGVGGTDESTIRAEGAEHMRGQGSEGLVQGQSNFNEPGLRQQHDQGIDYVKNASGLREDGPPIVDDYGSKSAGETGLGSSSNRETGLASGTAEDSKAAGETGRDIANPSDPVRNSEVNAEQPTDSHPREDRSTRDTAGGDTSAKESKLGKGEGGYTPTQAQIMEQKNPDGPPPNIPTAGGERIGTKHWGESKIVPDNPPRRESEGGAGVSSKDGQSDDLTKKNTEKNADPSKASKGTSTSSQSNSGEKESVIDKIKDKLHMGHK